MSFLGHLFGQSPTQIITLASSINTAGGVAGLYVRPLEYVGDAASMQLYKASTALKMLLASVPQSKAERISSQRTDLNKTLDTVFGLSEGTIQLSAGALFFLTPALPRGRKPDSLIVGDKTLAATTILEDIPRLFLSARMKTNYINFLDVNVPVIATLGHQLKNQADPQHWKAFECMLRVLELIIPPNYSEFIRVTIFTESTPPGAFTSEHVGDFLKRPEEPST